MVGRHERVAPPQFADPVLAVGAAPLLGQLPVLQPEPLQLQLLLGPLLLGPLLLGPLLLDPLSWSLSLGSIVALHRLCNERPCASVYVTAYDAISSRSSTPLSLM